MITVALFGLMLASAPVPNPLAPALVGEQLCTSPDEALKTCLQIDTFRPLANGRFTNITEGNILGDEQPILFTLTTEAFVKGEALCGTIRASEVAAGRMRVVGKPFPAGKTAWIRSAFNKHLSQYINKEACTVFEETPEGLVARSTINGASDPGLDVFVKWVSPSDGYRLVH